MEDAEYLESGITALDSQLHEEEPGFLAGSIIVIEAPPNSQAEQMLYQFAKMRESTYITTQRDMQVLKEGYNRYDAGLGSLDVGIETPSSEDIIKDTRQLLKTTPDDSNIIIDSIDLLEQSEFHEYKRFLNELKKRVVQTDSLAILFSYDTTAAADNRKLTLGFADYCLEIQVSEEPDVSPIVVVRKNRGFETPEEGLKIIFRGSDIGVDSERTIS